jgi:rSAM/selenodomain-associated transferase 1
MTTCAMMFVKEPVPGSVKTRLQTHLSPGEAAELYRAFVADSATTLAKTSAHRKVIAYTPASGLEAVRDLLAETTSTEFEYVPQPEADLGQRMEQLFRDRFDEGVEQVVVVGSDSPSLPSSIVDDAFSLLGAHPLVLGPSVDGGYYLLGQSSPDDRVFSDVDWSTGHVLEQTLGKVQDRSLGLLPPWYDVDSPAEAAFLKVHLQAIRKAGGHEGEFSLRVLNRLQLPSPS